MALRRGTYVTSVNYPIEEQQPNIPVTTGGAGTVFTGNPGYSSGYSTTIPNTGWTTGSPTLVSPLVNYDRFRRDVTAEEQFGILGSYYGPLYRSHYSLQEAYPNTSYSQFGSVGVGINHEMAYLAAQTGSPASVRGTQRALQLQNDPRVAAQASYDFLNSNPKTYAWSDAQKEAFVNKVINPFTNTSSMFSQPKNVNTFSVRENLLGEHYYTGTNKYSGPSMSSGTPLYGITNASSGPFKSTVTLSSYGRRADTAITPGFSLNERLDQGGVIYGPRVNTSWDSNYTQKYWSSAAGGYVSSYSLNNTSRW